MTRVVLIRPKDNGLMLHYLWYPTEIARVSEFDNLELAKLVPTEMKMATRLIESLTTEFNPEQYEEARFKPDAERNGCGTNLVCRQYAGTQRLLPFSFVDGKFQSSGFA